MVERKITIPELEIIRRAQTVRDVYSNLNGDKFYQFQTMYHAVNGTPARPYDPDNGYSPKVAKTMDCLVRAVEILNELLSLDDHHREADARRCKALIRILQDESDSRALDDRLTPLQNLLIDLARNFDARFTGLTEVDPRKELLLIS